VRRIGQAARAGASGVAYSFCDAEERPLLMAIERLIRLRIAVVEEHPLRSTGASASSAPRDEGRRAYPARPQHHEARRPHEARAPHVAQAWRAPEGPAAPRPEGEAQAATPAAGAPRPRRFGGRPQRRYASY
jgi:ATP-dependent RNA helicase RhlE